MQIDYANDNVEKYFMDYSLMQRKIGKDITKIVKKRVEALKASKNIGIYLATGLGKPHNLHGNLNRCIGISLTGNYRLIIRPLSNSMDADELKICNIVEVKGVDDYHETKNNWIIS